LCVHSDDDLAGDRAALFDIEQLKARCAQNLSGYKRPKTIKILDAPSQERGGQA